MKIKDGFVVRQVGGNHIVVPVGSMTVDFNGIITLNETAAFLWGQLQQEHTTDELTELLLAEYDVDKATAEQDVARFLDALKEAELLA
ncbi:MAG: PqqD family protein [Clostridia bacterium]|nr:PqqD family protein [Clostridia bacterium]